MTTLWRGLTWDHPRGSQPLFAAARAINPDRDGFALQWDIQPLEGFESAPIADLCAQYDIVVMDHPHLGEAMAQNCLQPWDPLLGGDAMARMASDAVGPSFESYRMDGRLWALPLDAATQVSVRRSDLLEDAPATWAEAVDLAEATGRVAICCAGPHAVLALMSITFSMGEEPASSQGRFIADRAIGLAALELLARLMRAQPDWTLSANPIAILDYMGQQDDLLCCPLVYGYVNYADAKLNRPLSFSDAPMGPRGRRGSVLGGTGIALSARSTPDPALVGHLASLLGRTPQTGLIPDNAGQPSHREAWTDPTLNARFGGFYANTLTTMDTAFVRPRFNGYIAFQTEAARLIRAGVESCARPEDILDQIENRFARATT